MAEQSRKIAVLGDPATVLGFRGLGLETYALEDDTALIEKLKGLVYSNQYGILYITNALAEKAAPLLNELKQQTLPAIIPIAMGPQAAPLGQLALKDAVRRAVGFDILANHEAE